MPLFRRQLVSRLPRILALLLLAVAMLARPMLAAHCEAQDLSRFAAQSAAERATHALPSAPRDCCLGDKCGECCVPALAVMPTLPRLASMPPEMRMQLPVPAVRSVSADYPVDSRPPISV